jgi:rhamnulokinase
VSTTRAFAAVDLGASSGRVILGTHADGALALEEVHRFANGPRERAARLEWDADALFAEIVTGLTRTVSLLAERGLQLDGIGIDTWGVDYALLDRETGRIGPVTHYLGADPAGPARAAAFVPEERSYAITGVLPQHINTAYRLRDEAETERAPRTVLLTADLWVYLLTGVPGADWTLASTTQLLDARRRAWSAELVEAWGLDHLELPPLSPAGTLAGATTPEITARIGAPHPVAVYRVAEHDTASALAFATPGSGELLVSSGSWSLVGLSLDAPLTTPEALAAGFTNELAADGSVLLLRNLPGMLMLGECVRHWESQGREVPGVLELVLAAAEAGLPGSVFDVGDERALTSVDMPAAIVELCRENGTTPPVTEVEFAAAVVESLARAYADSTELISRVTGSTLTSIRIVGGGSLNTVLCARTAELAGLPVVAGPAEASALGNIAVQLVASGGEPGRAAAYDAAARVTHVRTFDPVNLEGPA